MSTDPNTRTLAREAFLHEPNWIKYFYRAAYPSPSEFPGPNMGLDSPTMTTTVNGDYVIGATRTFAMETPGVVTRDRRIAVNHLVHHHPMLTTPPPSEYVWGPNPCPSTDIIDRSDYIDGLPRRVLPKRSPNLYFDPCPANTFYGLGWHKMKGFSEARPEVPDRGCLPPVFYMDRD